MRTNARVLIALDAFGKGEYRRMAFLKSLMSSVIESLPSDSIRPENGATGKCHSCSDAFCQFSSYYTRGMIERVLRNRCIVGEYIYMLD